MIDRVVIEYLKGDSIIFRVLTTYKLSVNTQKGEVYFVN